MLWFLWKLIELVMLLWLLKPLVLRLIQWIISILEG
jgi:hypothetical protein